MKKVSIFAISFISISMMAGPALSDDLATGNMADAVKAMDANADGMVSKSEYMTYQAADYDKKSAQFATGNMTDAVKAQQATKRQAHLKAEEARFDKMTKTGDGQVMAKDMLGYLKGPAGK